MRNILFQEYVSVWTRLPWVSQCWRFDGFWLTSSYSMRMKFHFGEAKGGRVTGNVKEFYYVTKLWCWSCWSQDKIVRLFVCVCECVSVCECVCVGMSLWTDVGRSGLDEMVVVEEPLDHHWWTKGGSIFINMLTLLVVSANSSTFKNSHTDRNTKRHTQRHTETQTHRATDTNTLKLTQT